MHYLVACQSVSGGFEENVGPLTDAACQAIDGATTCYAGLCNVPNNVKARTQFEKACQELGATDLGRNESAQQGVFGVTDGGDATDVDVRNTCFE